jgi:hypothetical protein
MVETSSTPFAFMAMAQDATKAHPHPCVFRRERGFVTVLVVFVPATNDGVDRFNDRHHAITAGSAGFGTDSLTEL